MLMMCHREIRSKFSDQVQLYIRCQDSTLFWSLKAPRKQNDSLTFFFSWGMGLAQVSVARGSNTFPVEGETCSHGYGVLQVVIFWWPQTNKREVAPKEGGGQEEGLRNHRFATDKKTLMYGSFFPVSKRKYVALLILKKKRLCCLL